ncbi:MAG: hypothetical protein M5U34_19090 [Chloroflexi bacterium]|nr:hypothetical protein [Chloroflexota bacterium]
MRWLKEEKRPFPLPFDATIPTPEGTVCVPPRLNKFLCATLRPPRAAPKSGDPAHARPLSYNPDDHYWLIRPIPSGSRNYDLEWYPFGNDCRPPTSRPTASITASTSPTKPAHPCWRPAAAL